MLVNTRHFGEVDIEENKFITFVNGLPGFVECKKFVLIQDSSEVGLETEGVFWYLQSIDRLDASFVLMDVLRIMPDYNPIIDVEDLEALGEYNQENLCVYNVAVIPNDVTKISVNLAAPIIINEAERKGAQVIANNEEYKVRFYIFDELKKKSR